MTVYHDEGRRLRALASDRNTGFKFTGHAQIEMRKDGVTKLDVQTVLRRAPVIRVESNKMEETWNARGHDDDGKQIEIVVVAYEDILKIKIVTVWEVKR